MDELRDYEPISRAAASRRSLERSAARVLIGGTALKWGFIFAKFFGFFISVAAYTLWFGSWTFALGFVAADPRARARPRRRGAAAGTARVAAPTFIPFFGAFVTIRHAGLTPWRSALISLAGPLVGGARRGRRAGRSAQQRDSTHARCVLAYIGFLLNAFNLLPIGFLDGGQVVARDPEAWRDAGDPLRGRRPGRRRSRPTASARCIDRASSTLGLAAALVLGMLATRHSATLSDARTASSSQTHQRARAICGEHTAPIADEFFAGFEAVEQIDRPAVSFFGSARVPEGIARLRARARDDGAALRGGGLGGRHRRRARRDGGGEPRLPGGRRALGRLQHRAAARAGRRTPTSTSRSPSTTSTRARRCS